MFNRWLIMLDHKQHLNESKIMRIYVFTFGNELVNGKFRL